jgi:DNA invertase Pin-like site-specific DNA recombinase
LLKKAYGYCRASTGKQTLTFEAQRQQIERYYKQKLEGEGYEWGGFFEDKATSGGKPFTEREQGLRLFVAAQPGDAIIWTKMDRAFRSVRDGANTLHLLKQKGISIHSIDINLDTSTALGEFVCHLLMLLGELERSWVSTRTKEAFDARRRNGQPAGSVTPAGWRALGKGKDRTMEVDPKERKLMDRVYADYVGGQPIELIATILYNQGHKRVSGDRYGPDFLLYALHARALGYPALYYRDKHRETMKSMGRMRGREAVLARLRMFEARNEARPQIPAAACSPSVRFPGEPGAGVAK